MLKFASVQASVGGGAWAPFLAVVHVGKLEITDSASSSRTASKPATRAVLLNPTTSVSIVDDTSRGSAIRVLRVQDEDGRLAVLDLGSLLDEWHQACLVAAGGPGTIGGEALATAALAPVAVAPNSPPAKTSLPPPLPPPPPPPPLSLPPEPTPQPEFTLEKFAALASAWIDVSYQTCKTSGSLERTLAARVPVTEAFALVGDFCVADETKWWYLETAAAGGSPASLSVVTVPAVKFYEASTLAHGATALAARRLPCVSSIVVSDVVPVGSGGVVPLERQVERLAEMLDPPGVRQAAVPATEAKDPGALVVSLVAEVSRRPDLEKRRFLAWPTLEGGRLVGFQFAMHSFVATSHTAETSNASLVADLWERTDHLFCKVVQDALRYLNGRRCLPIRPLPAKKDYSFWVQGWGMNFAQSDKDFDAGKLKSTPTKKSTKYVIDNVSLACRTRGSVDPIVGTELSKIDDLLKTIDKYADKLHRIYQLQNQYGRTNAEATAKIDALMNERRHELEEYGLLQDELAEEHEELARHVVAVQRMMRACKSIDDDLDTVDYEAELARLEAKIKELRETNYSLEIRHKELAKAAKAGDPASDALRGSRCDILPSEKDLEMQERLQSVLETESLINKVRLGAFTEDKKAKDAEHGAVKRASILRQSQLLEQSKRLRKDRDAVVDSLFRTSQNVVHRRVSLIRAPDELCGDEHFNRIATVACFYPVLFPDWKPGMSQTQFFERLTSTSFCPSFADSQTSMYIELTPTPRAFGDFRNVYFGQASLAKVPIVVKSFRLAGGSEPDLLIATGGGSRPSLAVSIREAAERTCVAQEICCKLALYFSRYLEDEGGGRSMLKAAGIDPITLSYLTSYCFEFEVPEGSAAAETEAGKGTAAAAAAAAGAKKPTTWYMAEARIKRGQFRKFTNSTGARVVGGDLDFGADDAGGEDAAEVVHAFAAAFSHWTLVASGRRLLVADVQGQWTPPATAGSSPTRGKLTLTDPALHVLDPALNRRLRHMLDANYGATALERFEGRGGGDGESKGHVCGAVCKALQLPPLGEVK